MSAPPRVRVTPVRRSPPGSAEDRVRKLAWRKGLVLVCVRVAVPGKPPWYSYELRDRHDHTVLSAGIPLDLGDERGLTLDDIERALPDMSASAVYEP